MLTVAYRLTPNVVCWWLVAMKTQSVFVLSNNILLEDGLACYYNIWRCVVTVLSLSINPLRSPWILLLWGFGNQNCVPLSL